MAYDEQNLGHHEKYKPTIDVRAFSSRGISYRLRGWHSGKRDIHLLSTPERDFFYCLESDPSIYDIREQFPLNPAFTTQIAKQWNLKHPIDRKTRDPFEMTTDFIVTRRNRNNVLTDTAYSVKTLEELYRTTQPNSLIELRRKLQRARESSEQRHKAKNETLNSNVTRSCDEMWQRIRIEEKYWARRKVSFHLVSDGEIDYILSRNIAIIHHFYRLESLHPLGAKEIEALHSFMYPRVCQNRATLTEIGEEADQAFGYTRGTSMSAAKHFIARRRWEIDLTREFDPDKCLELI